MRNRVNLILAVVLFAAGIVCFAESFVLAGNVLVVAAGVTYAAGSALRSGVRRPATAVPHEDEGRTSL